MAIIEYTTHITQHGLRNKSKQWLIDTLIMYSEWLSDAELTAEKLKAEIEELKK